MGTGGKYNDPIKNNSYPIPDHVISLPILGQRVVQRCVAFLSLLTGAPFRYCRSVLTFSSSSFAAAAATQHDAYRLSATHFRAGFVRVTLHKVYSFC